MKKILLTVMIVFTFFINVVHADMGPKPSVDIEINGINEPFYATLLGKGDGYGPWFAIEIADQQNEIENIFIRNADAEYKYWGQVFELDGTKNNLHWGYYAPAEFKLLIYIPSTGEIIKSEPIAKEQFEQKYVCTVSNGQLEIKADSQLMPKIGRVLFRLVATLVIEVVIGLLFGFRTKKQISLIVKTNIFTQAILNVIFMVIETYSGFLAALIFYVPLEILIFIIEALIYRKRLDDKKWKTWLYSLFANGVSAYLGIFASIM